jgi:DNA-binding NarL/FixJ family response regulator
VAEQTRPTTVLVADRHSLFRAALRVAFGNEPDLCIVGEAGNGENALAEAQRLRPDVALLDADLSRLDGIATCARIKAEELRTRVLMMSDEADQGFLRQSLAAGADGYVSKGASLRELVLAVRTVALGEAFVPPNMLGTLLRGLIDRRRDADAIAERVSRLSRREREVLALMVAGRNQDGIAEALVVSRATARTHVQNVIRKLEVHSRLEARALVVEHDLLDRLVPPPEVSL